MGLLDQLLGSVLGQTGGGQHQNALLDLAASLIQNQPGGLSGLVEKFTSAGLGQQVASWVSTGQNRRFPPTTSCRRSVVTTFRRPARSSASLGPRHPEGWRRSCRLSSTS
jgi:hypothetical protein